MSLCLCCTCLSLFSLVSNTLSQVWQGNLVVPAQAWMCSRRRKIVEYDFPHEQQYRPDGSFPRSQWRCLSDARGVYSSAMPESLFVDDSPESSWAAIRWNSAGSTCSSVVEKWKPGSRIDSLASFGGVGGIKLSSEHDGDMVRLGTSFFNGQFSSSKRNSSSNIKPLRFGERGEDILSYKQQTRVVRKRYRRKSFRMQGQVSTMSRSLTPKQGKLSTHVCSSLRVSASEEVGSGWKVNKNKQSSWESYRLSVMLRTMVADNH